MSVIMAAVLMLSLVSCGAASNDMAADYAPGGAYNGGDYKAESDYDIGAGAPETGYPTKDGFSNGSIGASDAVTDTARKRIQYVNVSMESTEYDETLGTIKAKCSQLGGYIEMSDEYGKGANGYGSRSANLTLRIPQEKLDEFTGGLETLGHILSFTTDTDDVTDSYYDIEARLASLEAQRDRYMALLEKAEEMEDILVIDKALTEVIYQIESYTGTLNKYDALVAYSTVRVYLNEVIEFTEEIPVDPTFGERITDAFVDSTEAFIDIIEGTVVALAAITPFLIIPVIIVVVVIIAVRSNGKKKQKKLENMKTE